MRHISFKFIHLNNDIRRITTKTAQTNDTSWSNHINNRPLQKMSVLITINLFVKIYILRINTLLLKYLIKHVFVKEKTYNEHNSIGKKLPT